MRYFIGLSISFLCLSAVTRAQTPERAIPSHLYDATYQLDYEFHGKARVCLPQPGDVLLATDVNWFWTLTHDMAFAFEPHNSAIIVARKDGRLAVLEAGPNDTLWVDAPDMLPHSKEYADKGPVWIRHRKSPLTAEQNARLTDFAERQVGKRFAIGRLGILLTPLRDRGPFRTEFMGKPHGDRASYYCAELVMEACVAAGLLDRETTRPSATFPHDLFYDQSYNRYISKHPPLVHDWEPPARWSDQVMERK